MATETTYYEFNKPAGTDLVNPLVDTNPNWDKTDAALHELDERSVANATETVVLGVHAISRLNTYTKFIKWIATANFAAGDTFTVDGNVVAASTPSGATLETGAYVTGAVVFACLNADDTAMTIYVSGTTVASDSQRLGGELPSYYATDARMTSAETDIDNIQALNGTTSIVGIGDGTLTGAVSSLNNDLSEKVDSTVAISETKIGKLGSDDLYRRVLIATGQSITTSTLIDNTLNLYDIKTLYRIDGSIKTNDAGFMPVTTGTSNTFATIRSDGVRLSYASGFGAITAYCIVLEYTKN